MEKQKLKGYLQQGMSTREIASLDEVSVTKSTVTYWINKHDLNDEMKYQKPQYKNTDIFNKVDSKEAAYILGFLLGDGHMDKDNTLSCSVAIDDKEVLYFFQEIIGCNVRENHTFKPEQRRFPHAKINIDNKDIATDMKKYWGGRLKKDRNMPIISPDYRPYLLLGFFDADGCITWGERKDRNRLWHKISFTSSLSLLEGVQRILLEYDIASKLRPKKGEDCYVLEFSDKERVSKFLDVIYPNDNFIILERKYQKAKALRLELG